MIKLLKNQYFILLIILVLALSVRLYKIDSPIADWHSWRQADTAAVTRNFIKEGFSPLIPKYDDMSRVADVGIPNLNRYRFVEFPIYNIAVYPFYLYLGIYDKYSRLVSVLFSLGSIVFLYLICKKYLGVATSLLTAGVYALLPFNIFFSRTTLPEPTFLFFALGMMYFVNKYIWKNDLITGFLAILFTATAFLIKPWAIFFVTPLIYSLYCKYGARIPKKFILFALISIVPFILWRLWILQSPEGIPGSSWLLNGDHIRFHPAFWWWLISERIGREILGATGLVLFVIGFVVKPKNSYFLHVWLISLFSYFAIFATGSVRHNYYQYIFVPIAAVFLTLGFVYLIKGISNFLPRISTIPLALLFLVLSFYFSWIQVKGFYQINNPVIVEAGIKADEVLSKNAIVVAPYNGDTAFLYQTNRPGFGFVTTSLIAMVADYGVTNYVSTSRDDKTNWVIRHFKLIEDNPKFVIADLTQIIVPLNGDKEP